MQVVEDVIDVSHNKINEVMVDLTGGHCEEVELAGREVKVLYAKDGLSAYKVLK